MRLKAISMAGFKSFADRTRLTVDEQIIGVVGPNGCGKSNIVDAIRWVMGESRASQLRQETNTDIIFNGSTTRKPMDLCSVEMHLQNDKSRDLGMWSEYAELSVRRQVERDGESIYFINGQRVRRRDVADMFSGTGTGARSYGVVEQEQISRIVQADAKRIRSHLEETAGVASYKERRRATERRIVATQENLARLDDMVTELQRQMAGLAKQARTTVRVRKHKQELEMLQRFEMQLRCEEMASASDVARARMVVVAEQVQKLRMSVVAGDKLVRATRVQRRKLHEKLGRLQGAAYTAQSKCAAVRQRQSEFNLLLEQEQDQHKHAKQVLQELLDSVVQLGNLSKELKCEVQCLEKDAASAQEQITTANAAAVNAQTVKDTAATDASAATALLQTVHYDLQQASAEQELAAHRVADLDKALAVARQDLSSMAPVEQLDAQGLAARVRQASATAQHAIANEQQRQRMQEDLVAARQDLVQAQARQGGLEAERDLLLGLSAATQKRQRTHAYWLTQQQVKTACFAELAELDAPGYERALDAALGQLLDGYPVDNLTDLAIADDLPAGIVLLGKPVGEAPKVAVKAGMTLLADKVTASRAWQEHVNYWLKGVYVADTVEQAMAAMPNLEAGVTVVTVAGHVLHTDHVVAPQTREAGIVWTKRRDQVVNQLADCLADIAALQVRIKDLTKEHDRVGAFGKELAQSRQVADERVAAAKLEHSRREHALEFRQQQQRRLRDIVASHARASKQRRSAQQQAQKTLERLESVAAKAQTKAQSAQVALVAADTALTSAREDCVSLDNQLRDTRLRIQHEQQRLQDLHDREQERQHAQTQARTRIVEFQGRIDKMGHGEFATELARASAMEAKALDVLATAQEAESQLATNENAQDQALAQLRAKLEATLEQHRVLELNATTKATERKAATRQLDELGGVPDGLEQLRPKYPNLSAVREWCETLQRRIESVGEINYAADTEYAECERRMLEVQTQLDDLHTSLASLQAAIDRIDASMLACLRGVFAKLNERFAKMFTGLFDGGHACIELVGDNLLTDGLVLRATPPGKRVSGIQALSGGEKSLTALAFLFALNDLNPPPFCVLDEVDAALDEDNTKRFCRLVKTATPNIQFFIITHNKMVIEMVDCLVGVTQEEKGVSKLVTVKIADALAYAQREATG